jgi:hypothetical protein
MAMKQLSKAIGLAAMAMSGVVLADAPTLKEVLDASGVTVSGFVDASYTRYDIEPNDQDNLIPNYFDNDKSAFGVKQAALTISSLPKEGFGALVNVTAGSDADWIHSYGGTDSGGFDLTQAYVQYATGPLTVIGGKFNTLAGAEVIAPTGNTNISRSIAFLWALPFTHTGVRLAYAPMDTLTLYAGVNNGWDQQRDINNGKTLELGLAWNAADWLSWTLQGYRGTEDIGGPFAPTGIDGIRTLVDTVLTIKPIPALSIVLNYDYGKQENGDPLDASEDATWKAIVGYVNYQFTDEWRASFRLEQFTDSDGYRFGSVGLDNGDLNKKTTGMTLTVGYAPSANFELRGEVRQDKGEEEIFVTDGATDSTDKARYYAVEALYKF